MAPQTYNPISINAVVGVKGDYIRRIRFHICDQHMEVRKWGKSTIFKKGRRGNPGNYRPVSLTSVPGKMVECFIKDKILKHIGRNPALHWNR